MESKGTLKTVVPPRRRVLLLLAALTPGCGTTPAKPPPAPIEPYQAADSNLSCAELNQEIGRTKERMSRLLEQGERDERNEANQRGSALGGAFGALISLVSQKVSKSREEPYGSETAHLAQAYQERLKHLEALGRSKGC